MMDTFNPVTNFDRITATPKSLASFLSSLNAVDTPWERAFSNYACVGCAYEDCPDKCPQEQWRDDPEWWLMQTAKE